MTSLAYATDTGWQYWTDIDPINVGQYDQSSDFVISVQRGMIEISYIDVYMHVHKNLPGDARFYMVVMYGPSEQWFDPTSLLSGSSLLQGIRVVLSPSANCGMSGADFRFTVLFAQRDISYEPASWQCITKIFHDIPSFQSEGALHLKLAYFLESSNNPSQAIMHLPSTRIPTPKVYAVFSVVTQPTLTVSTSLTRTLTTTKTTETSSSSTVGPLATPTGLQNILLYVVAAGGGLVAATLLVRAKMNRNTRPCTNCGSRLQLSAPYCKRCGAYQPEVSDETRIY